MLRSGNPPFMKMSYAQNLEDYHLWQAFADQPTGFYIDIGAGHPVADNVSWQAHLTGALAAAVVLPPASARQV